MKKVVLAIALLGLLAGPAVADIVQDFGISVGRYQSFGEAAAPRVAGQEIYTQLGVLAGASQGLNTWVTDDLALDWVTNSPASTVLDTASFSIHNQSNNGGVIDTVTLDLSFWVDDGASAPGGVTTPLLGGYTGITLNFMDEFNTPGSGLAEGFYTIVTLAGLNIDLLGNAGVWAGTRPTAMTGGANGIGQVGGGVPTLGSSWDGWYKDDGVAPGFVWWGGNPPGALVWELTVPEPGTLALLGLGGMMLLRRRRA